MRGPPPPDEPASDPLFTDVSFALTTNQRAKGDSAWRDWLQELGNGT
eukprot:gene1604-2520_t